MINEEIAAIFENMSRILAFKGANRFRSLAYERAARSLRDTEDDLSELARAGKIAEIPGIGQDLAGKIEEYIKTKQIRQYDEERRGIPEGLITLMDISGLGPKTLALLYEKYQIKDLDDLRRLLSAGELEKTRGFGKKKVENIQRGIDLWLARNQRISLGIALPMAEKLLAEIKKIEQVERADIAGSLRRGRETIGDIDLLVISADSPRVLREFTKLPTVKHVLGLGDTRATVIIEGDIQVDVRAVARESYGAALQYFTGSKEHSVRMRTLAQKQGLKLNEYGVFRGPKRLGGADEDEVYRLVGVPMIPPELREDRGEFEASMKGQLPNLIELDDLRGDLHTHTNYSDGRASIEEMADGATALGYEYIALTDHSQSARVAHGLDRDRLEQKIEELERVRARRAGGKHSSTRILLGAEVDILADGQLDYPDDILARCDVVVAAVHSAFRQSRDRMTKRLLAAIANPYVHILAHPLTRLMGSRGAIEFDYDRVLEAAIKAGVALEMNGQPLRLDLTDTMARVAQDAGALLAINSDAHSVPQLESMRYGVYQARRGWIEARSVVNSWPWDKLSRWLGQRRKRKSKAA
jgi:DNA polymerase (family X)